MNKKKAAPKNGTTQFEPPKNNTLHTGPKVTGQMATILKLLRRGPLFGLSLPVQHGITEPGARIHDLRAMGFNITTHIQLHVQYRGKIYRRAATYVLEHPEWSAPSQPDDDSTTS
jgi:hypothetical protein